MFDDSSRACCTSDCVGAPLTSPELAVSSNVGDVPLNELRARQLLWATVDNPWIHTVDPAKYLATVDPLRVMDPALILSTHLPPAVGRTADFLHMLSSASQADPFIGPDQEALEQMLAEFEPASSATA